MMDLICFVMKMKRFLTCFLNVWLLRKFWLIVTDIFAGTHISRIDALCRIWFASSSIDGEGCGADSEALTA
jgi:hypothetical protein